jgi:hypothetical protein
MEIMTIYSKEGKNNKKTYRRLNERKQGRRYGHGRGLQRENRNWEERRWKMQKERD